MSHSFKKLFSNYCGDDETGDIIIDPEYTVFKFVRNWLWIINGLYPPPKERMCHSSIVTRRKTQPHNVNACLRGGLHLRAPTSELLMQKQTCQPNDSLMTCFFFSWIVFLLSGFFILSSIFLCFLFYWLSEAVTMAHSGSNFFSDSVHEAFNYCLLKQTESY